MKYRFCVVLLVLAFFMSQGSCAYAKLLENPETVSYMHTIVSKSGTVSFERIGPFPRVKSLEISLSIPQNTCSQNVEILKVSGPDKYNISKDKWGNEIMNLLWNNPSIEKNLYYNVSFDVRTFQKTCLAPHKKFSLTELTEPTPEIKRTAYSETEDFNGTMAMFKLASWVYNSVEYKMGFEGFQKSARWVFENRKGVCDGHSNLLISLLRSLGYNAYYVVGYAYTERTPGRYFGPHGWVEAEDKGKVVTLDPTWLESPVDATHIKFSNSPDSNYSEYIWAMSNGVKIHWKRNEPDIALVEKQESPRVSINEEIVPESVEGEKNVIIIANVSSIIKEKCLLGRIEAVSCSRRDGSAFLDIEERNKTMMLCGNARVFWFAETPQTEKNMVYTCPVTVSGGGDNTNKSVVIKSGHKKIRLRIDTHKALLPGESFEVRAIIDNNGFNDLGLRVFLVLGKKLYEKIIQIKAGSSKSVFWNLKAPLFEGKYVLKLFSSGELEKENVTVSDSRHIRILNVSVPSVVNIGQPISINVSVLGLDNSVGEIVIRIGEKEERRVFSIENGEEKVFIFSSSPVSEGKIRMSIDVFSSVKKYEDGIVTTINIMREKNWLDRLIDEISELFKWLLSIVHLR